MPEAVERLKVTWRSDKSDAQESPPAVDVALPPAATIGILAVRHHATCTSDLPIESVLAKGFSAFGAQCDETPTLVLLAAISKESLKRRRTNQSSDILLGCPGADGGVVNFSAIAGGQHFGERIQTRETSERTITPTFSGGYHFGGSLEPAQGSREHRYS